MAVPPKPDTVTRVSSPEPSPLPFPATPPSSPVVPDLPPTTAPDAGHDANDAAHTGEPPAGATADYDSPVAPTAASNNNASHSNSSSNNASNNDASNISDASLTPLTPRRSPLVRAVAWLVVVALAFGSGATVALLWLHQPPAPTPVVAPAGSTLDVPALLESVGPAVVSVRSAEGRYGGTGTGVVLDDGLVLTNAHVVGLATSAEVVFTGGVSRPARLVGSFPSEDVAVLQVDQLPPGVRTARLGSSEQLRVGDPVVAIGNALGLGETPTVTSGIVSAKARSLQVPGGPKLNNLLQTDAAINPGNSGGPLVNAFGEVVGINTAIVADAQNIGFAIPIDGVVPLVDDIRAGGGSVRADRPFLGVAASPVAEVPASQRPAGAPAAALVVTGVVPDSPAAGVLNTGDVLVAVNGRAVADMDALTEALTQAGTTAPVDLTLVRDGREVTVSVQLVTRDQFNN